MIIMNLSSLDWSFRFTCFLLSKKYCKETKHVITNDFKITYHRHNYFRDKICYPLYFIGMVYKGFTWNSLFRLPKIIFWKITRLKRRTTVLVWFSVTVWPQFHTQKHEEVVDLLILFYDSKKINLRYFYENYLLAFSVGEYNISICYVYLYPLDTGFQAISDGVI